MTENPGGQRPLLVRSAVEAHIFLDLHACECGAGRSRGAQELREDGNGGYMSVYHGTCSGCGRPWRGEFTLPAFQPPDGSIGGPGPSAVIDPGEWVYVSDLAAAFPAGSAPGPEDRVRLARAAAAVREALKFVPEGLDRVPDNAFTAARGRAMRDAFPDRFLAADLRVRALLYEAGAALQGGQRSPEMTG
jgi:hypothetical protein